MKLDEFFAMKPEDYSPQMREAYELGRVAFKGGPWRNPYHWRQGDEFGAWEMGWCDAHDEVS